MTTKTKSHLGLGVAIVAFGFAVACLVLYLMRKPCKCSSNGSPPSGSSGSSGIVETAKGIVFNKPVAFNKAASIPKIQSMEIAMTDKNGNQNWSMDHANGVDNLPTLRVMDVYAHSVKSDSFTGYSNQSKSAPSTSTATLFKKPLRPNRLEP